MTKLPLTLRRATPDELHVVLDLLDESIYWLQGMGIDQWATPWPDEQRRKERIVRDIAEGKTWFAVDETAVAGTITIDPADNAVWPAERREEKAVHVRRVIVRRSYAGLGLGADWSTGPLTWRGRMTLAGSESMCGPLTVSFTTITAGKASGSAALLMILITRRARSSSGVLTRTGPDIRRCYGPLDHSSTPLMIAAQVAIEHC